LRKIVALVIVMVFVFGMTGTAFAAVSGLGLTIKDINANVVVKRVDLTTGFNSIVAGDDVGEAEANYNIQKNNIINKKGIPINFGDQTNKITAIGGGNQNSGNNTIKETIKQTIVDKDIKKDKKKLRFPVAVAE